MSKPKRWKIDPELLYVIIMKANDKQYVQRLSPELRQLLEKHVMKMDIDDCICCPCFAWEYDDNKEIKGCICTLGYVMDTEAMK